MNDTPTPDAFAALNALIKLATEAPALMFDAEIPTWEMSRLLPWGE
jgi:hypothetical protein